MGTQNKPPGLARHRHAELAPVSWHLVIHPIITESPEVPRAGFGMFSGVA